MLNDSDNINTLSTASISDIADTIARNMHPEKIILFGSYANGKPNSNSDLDLLIVMNTDMPRYKRASPIRLLFDPTPCPMDILVYTPEEVNHWNGVVNHIVTEAFTSGLVLYERKTG